MLAVITVPLILCTFFHVIKFFLDHDFNGYMKLYFKGILEFIPLLLNIFSVFVSSVCCTENLRRQNVFAGSIYWVLRIVSYEWNNEVGGV